MAIACDSASLMKAAKCFDCIPHGQQAAVQTYLLAVIAGSSTDPATLVKAAKCFGKCIPPGLQMAVQNYLLCQILNK